MKKYLICLLIFSKPVCAQDQQEVRTKNQFANHAVLIGSTVILAGGCFLTKKHWSKLAWVTKDKLVNELTKMGTGLKQDIVEAKCAVVKEIKIVDRNLSDLEMRITGKLNSHNAELQEHNIKLAELKASVDSMHQKIDQQQAGLQEVLAILRRKN